MLQQKGITKTTRKIEVEKWVRKESKGMDKDRKKKN